jgi:hypothetical protein
MKREAGLRRTALLTGALVAVGVTGTAVAGVAAYASDHSSSVTPSSTSTSTSATSTTTDSPSLSSGGDSGGSAATSGGS